MRIFDNPTAKLLLLSVLLPGCIVTKGRYELVEVQLEATRAAMNARQGQCQLDINERDESIEHLQSEIAGRQSQLDTLDVRIDHLQHDNEQLQASRTEWLTTPPSCPVEPPDPGDRRRKEEPIAPPEEAAWVSAEIDTTLAAMRHYAEHEFVEERREHFRSIAKDNLSELVEGGYAEVVDIHDNTVIRVPARKLFSEGRVSLSPRGREITRVVRTALVDLPEFMVQVRGHTDDRPFHSAEHESNWELGFARAVAVMRSLNVADLPMKPSAASYAATQPIADNNTEEGRKKNARIEIWLIPDPNLETLYDPSEVAPEGTDEGVEPPEQAPEPENIEEPKLPDEQGGTAKEE